MIKRALLASTFLCGVASAQTVNPPIIPPQSVGNPIPPQYSVLNLSALKLLNPTYIPSGALVNRQSYTAPPDNGYANYLYSASPCTLNAGAGDNGSQVIASTGGCWNAVYTDGVVRLGIFGADPTHAVSSDTAVANWFVACNGSAIAGNAQTGGNRCYAERGNYKLTTTTVTNWDLAFNRGGGLVIYGAGGYTTNFDFVNNGGYLLIHDSAYAGFFYSRFSDFGVSCANSSGGSGGCVQLGASAQDALNEATIENMRIANSTFAAGSAGLVINGFYNGHIRTVAVNDGCNVQTTFGVCASASGGDALKIYQAAFSYIQGSFSDASIGIHITGPGAGNTVTTVHFDAEDIEVVHTPVRIDTVYPQGAQNNKFDVSQYVFCSATFGCNATGVASLGAPTGGSGYVDGVYSNVPLTGGSGSGATAQITVAGGSVTSVFLSNTGTGYIVANTLSASNANLGGSGSGFNISVASLVTVQGYGIVSPIVNTQTFNNEVDLPSYSDQSSIVAPSCSSSTAALGVFIRAGTPNVSTPSVPSSGTPIFNTTGRPVDVFEYAGITSNTCYGPTAGTCLGNTMPAHFILNPCDQVIYTYSVAPSQVWQALP